MANSLLDFVISLVRDPEAAARYAANPERSIAEAHLTDVTRADVNSLIPVVSDSLSMSEPIERRWQERVSQLDIAVDEIPRIAAKDPESVQWPPEVIADGPIALARLIPAGVDVRGNATRARIVLFRKPIERRAKDTEELGELLHEILVAQVAIYLDVDPSVIDPTIDD